nr:hypothetical protein [Plesiomonas shigelloides]
MAKVDVRSIVVNKLAGKNIDWEVPRVNIVYNINHDIEYATKHTAFYL